MAEEQQESTEKEESGVQIHTLETDMQMLGVEDATKEPEAQPEEEKAEKPETPDKPKKSRTQKRIERQQRDNNSLKDENQHLKDELAELRDKPTEIPEEKEIVLDDYDSYDEYLEALEEEGEKTPEKKEEVVKQPLPETPTAPVLDQTALNDMFEDGNSEYKDFEAKVRNTELELSADVIGEILKTDNPSGLIYQIASDPETAAKLSHITDNHDLIVAITKIDNQPKKETPDVPTQTKAPKPITPVSGNSIKGLSLNDEDLSFEQHEALLNAQQNTTRGGFI